MSNKGAIIQEELRKVSQVLGKQRFSREEFFQHSSIPITSDDLRNAFGSFAMAMVATGFKPAKWSKLSNEELFLAYEDAYKKLGHYPMGLSGYKELSKVTPLT